MNGLPVLSGKDVIRTLRKAGFVVIRQKGSHARLKKVFQEKPIKLTVPLHQSLKRGTLRRIISEAGLSVDEFLSLLKK